MILQIVSLIITMIVAIMIGRLAIKAINSPKRKSINVQYLDEGIADIDVQINILTALQERQRYTASGRKLN